MKIISEISPRCCCAYAQNTQVAHMYISQGKDILSVLLALCEGNPPVVSPNRRPVM